MHPFLAFLVYNKQTESLLILEQKQYIRQGNKYTAWTESYILAGKQDWGQVGDGDMHHRQRGLASLGGRGAYVWLIQRSRLHSSRLTPHIFHHTTNAPATFLISFHYFHAISNWHRDRKRRKRNKTKL